MTTVEDHTPGLGRLGFTKTSPPSIKGREVWVVRRSSLNRPREDSPHEVALQGEEDDER